MVKAISIASFIAVCLLLVVVGAVRRAPEGFEDADAFHLGKVPDLPPVATGKASLTSLQSPSAPEGSVQSPANPEAPTSDT